MIQVTISKTRNDEIKSMVMLGHAGYADSGQDIVCSAVSVLTINTINALSEFTSQKFEVATDEESGMIRIDFLNPLDHDAELLVNTMILGISSIEDDYDGKYIHVKFREV